VRELRYAVFDGYQRLFPAERTATVATIVVIDEPALGRYGQWPWPRTRLAQLVDRIARYQPAAIAFDLFFPEADRMSPAAIAHELPLLPAPLAASLEALPSNDEALAAAIRGRHVVLGIASGEADPRFPAPPRAPPIVLPPDAAPGLEDRPGHIGNVPVLEAAAQSRALMDAGPQSPVIRIVPMVARVQGVVVPALGAEALRVALDAGMRLERAAGGLLRLRVGRYSAPMQPDGTAWLRIGHHDPDRFISAVDVMDGKVEPEVLRGRVVLLGITGLGMLDFKTTPLDEFVPGVEIHAQVVENLFNGIGLARLPMAGRIEAAALLLCGFLLIAFLPRLNALQGINLTLLLVVLLFGAGLLAFLRFDLLFDPAGPAIGTFAVYGSILITNLSVAERQRRLLREQAAHMAGEVDAARRIQMGLLPDPRKLFGEDRRLDIAALLEPARTVGGDFYDCFLVDARRIFFVVADVSGKGLPAALFMASVKSHLKSAALRGGEAGAILSRAQEDIARENPEQLFVTVFAGLLDLASGELEYANAGHEPPFVRTPLGAPERFPQPGGPPLCVVERFAYPTGRRTLAAGEWICVVSDGATEAMNREREFFGNERLRASLTWVPADAGADAIVRRLRDDVDRFAAGAELADDITLLALRWEGAAG
jgi:adenylate cyclase